MSRAMDLRIVKNVAQWAKYNHVSAFHFHQFDGNQKLKVHFITRLSSSRSGK